MPQSENHRRQHGTPKKNQLVGAIRAGKSIAESSLLFSIPYSTARDIWKRYKNTGSTENYLRSGRPTKLSDVMKRHIIQTALKSRRKPFREIGNEIGIKVSEGTIRNVLREKGYRRCVARKVPYLTDKHRKARLSWAWMYRRFSKRNWQRVIWSDECYVYLGDNRG